MESDEQFFKYFILREHVLVSKIHKVKYPIEAYIV
jgi:hypothetical protein